MSEDPKRAAPSPRGDGLPPGGRTARPRQNAVGEERPAFLLQFPDDPELERLIRAYEEGNFAKVRAEAPELARRSTDEAVRRAARELRQRIDPDPLLVVLLVFALSLFAFLVGWIYTQ
jgi:hypothetical protein